VDEDEFEDEGFEHDECCVPSARFSPWDLAVAFFSMWMGVFQAIAGFGEYLLSASMMAANREDQDRRFHEQAALEIETLTNGGEDG
jgi:hypothetical protein